MSDPQQPAAGSTGASNPELDADVAIEEPGAVAPEAGTADDARATAGAPGTAADVPPPSRWHTMLHQIATGNAIISVLAVRPRAPRRRHHDRVHRRARPGGERLLLRPTRRHARRDLGVGGRCLLGPLPGLGLQLPARRLHLGHPAAHRDPDLRDAAHRRWPRRRPRVPRRHVQHRWPRPDAHRGIRRRLARLRIRPAVGHPHARRPRRRPHRRRTLGRHRRRCSRRARARTRSSSRSC